MVRGIAFGKEVCKGDHYLRCGCALKAKYKMDLRERISLKPYNTFGIEAFAERFGAFQTILQLQELLQENNRHDSPLLILGGGSNILLTENFKGLVLKNEITGIEVLQEDEECVMVRVGAGENWHRFVLYCLDNNLAGVENLALIPGSVGASPMQNIGAYGVEIKDVFHSLDALHIGERTIQSFTNQECAFGYRESVFKNRYKGQFVITSVTYRLHKKPHFNTSYGAIQQELEKMGVQELSIQAVARAVMAIRSSKLPDWKVTGNAGSFFKNPQINYTLFERLKAEYPAMPSFPIDQNTVKLPAGWLIEQCGWKGYRKGDAGCYSKQALVLVNYGKATGREIYTLSEEIIRSVEDKFGISLEREVNII
jgi:UDP-N-acetylmuramate dehydrogenase